MEIKNLVQKRKNSGTGFLDLDFLIFRERKKRKENNNNIKAILLNYQKRFWNNSNTHR